MSHQDRKLGRPPVILVVDDDRGVRETTRRILRRHGFEVVLADRGEAAVRLFEAPPFHADVILMDYSMPGIHGIRAIEMIRDLGVNVPVILCTGYDDTEEILEFCKAAGVQFLAKPYKIPQLLDAVQKVLSATST